MYDLERFYMSGEQVAEFLEISKNRVSVIRKKGKIEFGIVGNYYIYVKASVIAYKLKRDEYLRRLYDDET